MNKQELVEEIKYIVSLANDAAQFEQQSAYLADLTEEFGSKGGKKKWHRERRSKQIASKPKWNIEAGKKIPFGIA